MVVPPLSVKETNLDFPKEDIIEQKIMDCFSSQSQLRCFFRVEGKASLRC